MKENAPPSAGAAGGVPSGVRLASRPGVGKSVGAATTAGTSGAAAIADTVGRRWSSTTPVTTTSTAISASSSRPPRRFRRRGGGGGGAAGQSRPVTPTGSRPAASSSTHCGTRPDADARSGGG